MDVDHAEPFQVQTAECVRLTRNREQLLLHNVATGEVVPVEESTTWTSVELDIVEGQGVVLQHKDLSGATHTTSVYDWLRFQKDEDDLVDLGDNTRSQWGDVVKTTLPLALSLTKGQSVFSCELQCAKVPNESSCSIFWHIRWIVDWLGGHKNSNFIGQGAKSWANKVTVYLVHVLTDMMADEDEIAEIAKQHFLSSGHSVLRSPTAVDKDKVQMTEYSASSFAILVMLAHWAARGPNKRSQWKLAHEQVQSQASSLLKLLLSTFVTTELRMDTGETTVCLRVEADDFCLDWPKFCEAESLVLLQRMFDAEQRMVPLHEAVMMLCKEETNTRVSLNRRLAATQGLAWLTQALVWVIESSKRDEIWRKTELWQLQPLRTDVCSGKRGNPGDILRDRLTCFFYLGEFWVFNAHLLPLASSADTFFWCSRMMGQPKRNQFCVFWPCAAWVLFFGSAKRIEIFLRNRCWKKTQCVKNSNS